MRFKKVLKRTLGATLLASTIGSMAIGPTFAAYQKTAINGSNFAPGQTVQVEIRVTPPTSVTIQPVEAVFVIDTSNSIAGQISTFKSNLNSFADNLTSAYGHIKVGIVTFGNDPSKNDDDPQILVPEPLTAINTSADITNLKNAIGNIQAHPTATGFSDIQAGLNKGNNLFSSGATNGKYLSLLTDGIDNMPAYGSYFSNGTGNFNGICLLNSSGAPTITPRYTQLTLVDASTGAYVNYGNNDTSTQGMGSANWPCTGYMSNVYGSSITGTQLLQDMANRSGAYPNTVYKTGLNDSIQRVTDSLTPSFINVHDIVNTSIMYANPNGQSITNGNFYNCDTNALLSNGYMFTPNGRRVDAQIGWVSGVSNYCFRFNVVLQSGVAPGTYAIDNPNDTTTYSYPYNTVQYYNKFNDVISQDYVSAGSINIVAYDLSVPQNTNFNLANSSGTQQSVFTTSDSIYVHYRPQNNTAYTTPSGAVSQIFANAQNPVSQGTVSDKGISVPHGSWGANAGYTYDSWPNGNYSTVYVGGNSWTEPVGDYVARAYVNYQQSSGPVLESNYANNQATSGYSVITPPVQQAPSNVSCTTATVNWTTGSSNITGYKVNLTPPDGASYPVSVAKTATSLNLSNLKEKTAYTWTLIASTINGDYTVPTGANSSFTTAECPHFTVSDATINATPLNNTSTNYSPGQLTITYTSSAGTWAAGNQINSTIVAFQSGSTTCSSYNPKGAAAATTVNGVTFTFANDTSTNTTTYNGSSIPLKVIVAPTVTTGTYTACIGSWSPVSPDQRLSTVTIKINMTPWFEVGGPTATSTSAGDVFSNGGISFMPVPYSPIRKYFFINGSQGVVASNGLVGILSDTQSSGADWRAANYPSTGVTQKTLDYSAMLTNAGRTTPLTTLTGDQSLLVNQNCNNGKDVTERIKGNATVASKQDFTLGNGCEGVNLTYFVDGNLKVQNDVNDLTNAGTLVFVVQGNITVDPGVAEMDGVYMFGGSFSDGTVASGVDQQLKIKGSLLGLAGQSPNANTGTFMSSSNQTGLQRNLGPTGAGSNQDTPGELIYYQPKYLYALSGSVLSGSTFSWVE